MLEGSCWNTVFSTRLKHEEAIHMKEVRAINWCIRRGSKDLRAHNSRRLVLCDDMSVALSFERKRAHVYPLLRQVRLFSALGLTAGTHHSIRWIPSELNPSDLPSRRFEKMLPVYFDKYLLSGEVTAEHGRYSRIDLLT